MFEPRQFSLSTKLSFPGVETDDHFCSYRLVSHLFTSRYPQQSRQVFLNAACQELLKSANVSRSYS